MSASLKAAIAPLLGLVLATASGSPVSDGVPDFVDAASESLALRVLEAHGGAEPWQRAESLEFRFFTKMTNGPTPWYSFESLDLRTGAAYVDWLLLDATVGWDTNRVWSRNWPMPLSAGFFVRMSSTFMTLPWQIWQRTALIGPVTEGMLPEDNTRYEVLRVRFTERSPGIPGTYYELFVDPEKGLVRGVRFDISHPGMASDPEQPLGPKVHVFGEYRRVGGLVLPTVYESFGRGAASEFLRMAYHFAWDIRLDKPFDSARVRVPEDAVIDQVSLDWWRSRSTPLNPEPINTKEDPR